MLHVHAVVVGLQTVIMESGIIGSVQVSTREGEIGTFQAFSAVAENVMDSGLT